MPHRTRSLTRKSPPKSPESKLYPHLKDTENVTEDDDKTDDTDECDFEGQESEPQTPSPPRTSPAKHRRQSREVPRVQKLGTPKSDHDSSHHSSFSSRSTCSPKSEKAKYGNDDDWSEWIDENRPGLFGIAFAILLGLILIYRAYSTYLTHQQPVIPKPAIFLKKIPESSEIFRKKLIQMKKSFPGQEKMIWPKLKAALNPLLKSTDPTEPATILLVSPDSRTAKCFGRKLASASAEAYYRAPNQYGEIHSSEFDNMDSDEAKELLDSKLHQNLGSDEIHAILLHDIHTLNGASPLMLHAYCDNDNAPFKDNVIILTINMQINNDGTCSSDGKGCAIDEERCDDWIEKLLYDHWSKNLGKDKIGALWSRIGNNVICLKPEPDAAC